MTKSKAVGGMGFRDLALFNDSLLAKQAWRLLHDHNNLYYKVFKARFFPNTMIMEAKDSRLGFYAWKSILIGRDVIQRGVRWRVGNGKKIRVWQDHWLPRKHAPFLSVCPIADFEDSTVDILIDPQTRQWNVEMVEGLFNEEEAELIKQIPLSRSATEDTLFWPYSSNRLYSCKAGYKFLKMEEELMERAHDSATNEDTQVWKQIWSMNVPQKVKTLLWRACSKAMPTKHSLFRCKITEDDLYVRCRAATENSLHALWLCSELDLV